MEKYEEMSEAAKRKLKIADHMLTQTYPMLNDPKLLLTVLENIFLTFNASITAILYYESFLKNITSVPDAFESKFTIFSTKVASKYNLDRKYLKIISEIKELLMEHKKSPIEFRKDDKYIIADDNYKLKTITTGQIKKFIDEAKNFIMISDKLMNIPQVKK